MNFKNHSFILPLLSPALIRELKLFSGLDDTDKDYLEVTAIRNEAGYQYLREALAANYDLGYLEPYIQLYNVNVRGDCALTLRHTVHNGRSGAEPCRSSGAAVAQHLHQLWAFDVTLEFTDNGTIRDCTVYSEL